MWRQTIQRRFNIFTRSMAVSAEGSSSNRAPREDGKFFSQRIHVPKEHVFYDSPDGLSFAFVNLKPVFPGHILIAPVRYQDEGMDRFANLTPSEVSSMWMTAQLVGKVIEKEHGAESLSFIMQDGPAAGQTVPHCHIHIMPRRHDDKFNAGAGNDSIYPASNTYEKLMADALVMESPSADTEQLQNEINKLRRQVELFTTENQDEPGRKRVRTDDSDGKEHVHVDEDHREPRSFECRAIEAEKYRNILSSMS